eukprot:Gb_20576 [translate_table: standard]
MHRKGEARKKKGTARGSEERSGQRGKAKNWHERHKVKLEAVTGEEERHTTKGEGENDKSAESKADMENLRSTEQGKTEEDPPRGRLESCGFVERAPLKGQTIAQGTKWKASPLKILVAGVTVVKELMRARGYTIWEEETSKETVEKVVTMEQCAEVRVQTLNKQDNEEQVGARGRFGCRETQVTWRLSPEIELQRKWMEFEEGDVRMQELNSNSLEDPIEASMSENYLELFGITNPKGQFLISKSMEIEHFPLKQIASRQLPLTQLYLRIPKGGETEPEADGFKVLTHSSNSKGWKELTERSKPSDLLRSERNSGSGLLAQRMDAKCLTKSPNDFRKVLLYEESSLHPDKQAEAKCHTLEQSHQEGDEVSLYGSGEVNWNSLSPLLQSSGEHLE